MRVWNPRLCRGKDRMTMETTLTFTVTASFTPEQIKKLSSGISGFPPTEGSSLKISCKELLEIYSVLAYSSSKNEKCQSSATFTTKASRWLRTTYSHLRTTT